ncbi:hypothetical protein TNCV_2916661 [Trichonephila clavipes]|nr:hypothetical protein TNCV_2916661 [Trichonephila clavipes]
MIAVVQIVATSKFHIGSGDWRTMADRGSETSRGCMEIRFSSRCSADSDQKSTARSIRPREFVTSAPHRGLCPLKSTEQNKWSWQLTTKMIQITCGTTSLGGK